MTDLELKAIKEKVAADAKVIFDKQNSELQSQVEEKVNAAFEKLVKVFNRLARECLLRTRLPK